MRYDAGPMRDLAILFLHLITIVTSLFVMRGDSIRVTLIRSLFDLLSCVTRTRAILQPAVQASSTYPELPSFILGSNIPINC